MNKIISSAIAVMMLWTQSATFAQQSINAQRIDSFLTYLTEQNRFMGAVSILEDGKTVFNKAYGIMGRDQGDRAVAANEHTRYRIGSISKTYTAVMIMQLVEAKKLSLDDKLSHFYKDIPNADKITIRQLLTHQSGLYNYTEDPEWVNTASSVSEADLLKKFAAQKPDFEPGTSMAYSNTNYVLLGFIVSKLTGMSYNDALQQFICKKAGLQAVLPSGNAVTAHNEAVSFILEHDQWEPVPETHVTAAAGAGGIVASAEATARFLEALFELKLTDSNSLRQMLPGTESGKISELNSYGFGIFTMPFGKHIGYGHNGHIDAFHTSAGYFPEDKLTISIFANGLNMPLNDIAIGVLSIIYQQPYTFPDFKTVAVSETELNQLSGVYSTSAIPMKITISQKEGVLWAQATGQDAFPTEALSRDRFEFKPAGILMEFERDASGKGHRFMLNQGGSTIPFVKEDSALLHQQVIEVDEQILATYEGVYSSADFPLKITIRKEGNQLTAQATGQSAFPLDAISTTEFKFDAAGILITFRTDENGKVSGLILKQGTEYELDKE